MLKKIFPPVIVLIFVCGLFFTCKGLYIFIKAQVAQVLLEYTWENALHGKADVKPWPWADFRPVACLSFPEHHYRTIVVNSASGTSLAFAPGHLDGSPAPGSKGNCVIFGHRETHFSVLQYLEKCDTVCLLLDNGSKRKYKVSGTRVVDRADNRVMRNTGGTTLTLITCYPFHSILPGNKRFIVTAIP